MDAGNDLLDFDVVECSSEQDGFGCSSLKTFNQDGEGWRSEPHCTFPQTLVLKINQDGINGVDKLELLSHQFCISETIEIVIGSGSIDGRVPSSLDGCRIVEKLGYITLDCNKQSNFRDRELKSVPIQKEVYFIKLILHQCHQNERNIEDQVGLVGLRLIAGVDKSADPKTNNFRSMKMNLPSPLPKSLPPNVKHELDPKTAQCVDRLEQLKKERAALEDFDMALKIKDALGTVYALLISYKECESNMRKAALQEEYSEASRLKVERDKAKEMALESLTEVEQEFIGSLQDIDRDLSLSTIKDDSFLSHKSVSIDRFNDNDDMSIASKIRSPVRHNSSKYSESSMDVQSFIDDRHDDDSYVPSVHPLAGVENAEDLPVPEDIAKDISPDLAQKIEDTFGSYRAKCLLSKNWQLRDAALGKIVLMMPGLCSETSAADCEHTASLLAMIISRCIDDNNVKVYQSGLIALDEMLVLCENHELGQSNVTLMLSKVVTEIVAKLADSSRKVVESAELSLLAMAHSLCVGVAHISNQVTKKVRTADSKSGRTIKARLQFVDRMIAEFEDEVPLKRVIDFAKASKAFDHKDGGVRDALKSVVLSLMMVHGESDVLKTLGEYAHTSTMKGLRI